MSPVAFPAALTTDRLVLRPFVLDDAEAVFDRYAGDPEVTRHLAWATHASVEVTRGFLATVTGDCPPERRSREHVWAITLADDPLPCGSIGLTPTETGAMLGYVLGRPWHGSGLMTEAACAVIDCAWNDPSVWRVNAYAHVDNVASRRVMEKCGMRYEGIARRAVWQPQFDEPQDAAHYAIVRDDVASGQ
ncbi:ribosomal-protein-S5-alanine N-acetyltransferase [Posidoniimonas polymericola]|uniref:Ribosomal-protein-S5-alanine N-acetyltransferase n=1 Tax=Posidoniimonas polymericola TaxID=2528002 RepID=A0A5C5YSI8_9BACT|nr:GNAT family N-acetyltransferase [Posidoniimonas polymericola]TWT77919.1 ribosomal-protein-S5-alanine N-acetyltransferase [Posidoniimonas polymericola]